MSIYNPESNQHSNDDTESFEPVYYDVHCFIDRKHSYSIPVKIISHKIFTDNDVINYCLGKNLFVENGDEDYVDYVSEITKEEYKQMKL